MGPYIQELCKARSELPTSPGVHRPSSKPESTQAACVAILQICTAQDAQARRGRILSWFVNPQQEESVALYGIVAADESLLQLKQA